MSLTDVQPKTTKESSGVRPLDDRLAEVVGLVNVCTAEMVDLIAEALRTGAWEGWGIRSPEHWVTWKCGVSPSRARRLVALARGLGDLPETRRAFQAGSLSEDQTAVVVRHTDRAHDSQVAALAVSLTVPQLRRVLPSVPRTPTVVADSGTSADSDSNADPGVDTPAGPPRPPADIGTRRQVAMGYGEDGGFWCSIRLPGDEGALVERALTYARQVEHRRRHPDRDQDAHPELHGVSWADALLRLAEAGLTDLESDTSGGRPPSERTQVIVHLDADGDAPPRLHLGPVLPPGIADHLSCDASVRLLLTRHGIPVARGRRTRTVGPVLRVAIEDRDQSCRVPGCGHHRWLHIHHLRHWSRGGRTDPGNLVALCPAHHRMVHKGLLRVEGDPTRSDGLRFFDGHGRELVPARPRPPAPGMPPAEAATTLGLPDPGWNHPSGEPLDTRWIAWN